VKFCLWLFHDRFRALPTDAVGESQSASQFSQSSQYSQNQDIMSKATFMTLAEINNIKKVIFQMSSTFSIYHFNGIQW